MQKKDKLTNNSSGVFIVEGPKCNRWKEAGKIQKYHSCDVFSYSLVVSNNTQSVNPNSHISGAHFESIQTVFTTATCIISSLNTGRQKQKFALLLNIQVVFDTCFCTFIPVFIWDQNQKHQHATRQCHSDFWHHQKQGTPAVVCLVLPAQEILKRIKAEARNLGFRNPYPLPFNTIFLGILCYGPNKFDLPNSQCFGQENTKHFIFPQAEI